MRPYNAMVSSFESRLIVTANKVRRLGGAPGARALSSLGPVNEFTRPLNDAKWGVDDAALPEGVGEIIEFDDVDE